MNQHDVDTDSWPVRAARLRDELVTAQKLVSLEWQEAVLATPRHDFVSAFYQRDKDGEFRRIAVNDPTTRDAWWSGVYRNSSLVTSIGRTGRGANTNAPLSSSSAPGLMTRMLEALKIEAGHRVLEIGTGTGYNAALLCHRLGDKNVFSVDIDAELIAAARRSLSRHYYHPALAVIDGAAGWPEHAPYDRIIATCAVSHVPWTWAEQTVRNGLILVDVKIGEIGNLVLLQRHQNRLEGHFDAGYATFMHMRSPDQPVQRRTRTDRDPHGVVERTVALTYERLWEHPPLWFFLTLREQSSLDFGYVADPDTGGLGPLYYAAVDGSWCKLAANGDGTHALRQGGPRQLWDTIQQSIDEWRRLGEPHWDRFGLTVTPQGNHTVWIDDPECSDRWPLTNNFKQPY